MRETGGDTPGGTISDGGDLQDAPGQTTPERSGGSPSLQPGMENLTPTVEARPEDQATRLSEEQQQRVCLLVISAFGSNLFLFSLLSWLGRLRIQPL